MEPAVPLETAKTKSLQDISGIFEDFRASKTTRFKDIPQPESGTCTVTLGNNTLLITGNILSPIDVFIGGDVLVTENAKIACVDCDCSKKTAADGAPATS